MSSRNTSISSARSSGGSRGAFRRFRVHPPCPVRRTGRHERPGHPAEGVAGEDPFHRHVRRHTADVVRRLHVGLERRVDPDEGEDPRATSADPVGSRRTGRRGCRRDRTTRSRGVSISWYRPIRIQWESGRAQGASADSSRPGSNRIPGSADTSDNRSTPGPRGRAGRTRCGRSGAGDGCARRCAGTRGRSARPRRSLSHRPPRRTATRTPGACAPGNGGAPGPRRAAGRPRPVRTRSSSSPSSGS